MKSQRSASENPWKSLRERAGLTQREVSDSLGYTTPQFISNVERGRCGFPIEKLPRIKKLYKVSAEQIMEIVLSEERAILSKYFKKTN